MLKVRVFTPKTLFVAAACFTPEAVVEAVAVAVAATAARAEAKREGGNGVDPRDARGGLRTPDDPR